MKKGLLILLLIIEIITSFYWIILLPLAFICLFYFFSEGESFLDTIKNLNELPLYIFIYLITSFGLIKAIMTSIKLQRNQAITLSDKICLTFSFILLLGIIYSYTHI